MPALMQAYRLAWPLPALRTVAVDRFCSWSACMISSCSSAALSHELTSYGSAGTANIMCRKFPT